MYKLVTQDTVDEDIYEMGERKRQLSQAVLSDNKREEHAVCENEGEDDGDTSKGKTKGKKKGNGKKKNLDGEEDGGDDDLDAISRILSKALSRQGIQL